MKYIIWMLAWIVSQRVMMSAGIVYYQGFWSTVFSSIFSVIAVLFARESKALMTFVCLIVAAWCVADLVHGEIINGLVGLVMNAVLVIMALSTKKS